jgi:hypothetical protein
MEMEARYPELLSAVGDCALWRRRRSGLGLVTTIIEHQALTSLQRQRIAEFRLRQFVLWDWYDARRVAAEACERDPIVDGLPPQALHICVGTAEGRLLAYTCLQPAGDATHFVAAADVRTTVVTPARPLFPTERELFGPEVFSTLPALRAIPLARMREWACTVRNKLHGARVGAVAAMYESFCVPLLYALDATHGIEVILGNNNDAARKIYAQLGAAVLYAPATPARAPEQDGYWTSAVNEQGAFWPGVLALADLRAHDQYLRLLDAALDVEESALPSALRGAWAAISPAPHALTEGLTDDGLSGPYGRTIAWTSAISATEGAERDTSRHPTG